MPFITIDDEIDEQCRLLAEEQGRTAEEYIVSALEDQLVTYEVPRTQSEQAAREAQ